MSKISKRAKANLYRQTAKAFEANEYKWVAGRFGIPEQNTHCAVGGLLHEAVKAGLHGYETWNSAPVRDVTVERAVSKRICGKGQSLIDFNDYHAKSKEDVIKHLRMTARALEHGGKV